MRLSDVLPPEIIAPVEAGGIDVKGITAASSAVGPGWIFAALPGAKTDGARFIPDAIQRGASAIIVGVVVYLATVFVLHRLVFGVSPLT